MKNPLLEQLKHRRIALGLKQNDMPLRIGVSRQQYQRLEAQGNPRLSTLELVAKGLNSQLMLVPLEKRRAIQSILDGVEASLVDVNAKHDETSGKQKGRISDNPWEDELRNQS